MFLKESSNNNSTANIIFTKHAGAWLQLIYKGFFLNKEDNNKHLKHLSPTCLLQSGITLNASAQAEWKEHFSVANGSNFLHN